MINLERIILTFLPSLIGSNVVLDHSRGALHQRKALIKGTLIFVICLSCISSFAQQSSYVFVRNHPENTIANTQVQVKWFCDELLNPEGFNVYRKELGDSRWVKLNASPITKRPTIPQATLANDDELIFFQDIINNSPEDLQEDFVFFNMLLKSFESNDLAQFIGIFYEDKTAVSGLSYQYRVAVIIGGNERNLNASRTLKVGIYEKGDPVEGIEVYQERRHVAFNWNQDDQRFYSVNLYADDGEELIKLNSEPVILSMVPDSTGNLAYPRPMFKSKGFDENKVYSFYIEGVDYFGETTEESERVSFVFDDTTPPPNPQDLEGVADTMQVDLKWTQEDSPDLKGFHILRGNKSEGDFIRVNAQIIDKAVRTYQETVEQAGPYYYMVQAVDHANNSSLSERAFVDVQDVIPPAAPQGLTIQSDTGKFILRWQANTESDLLGYYVYRTIDNHDNSEYLLMNGDPIDSTSYLQTLPKVVKNDFFYYLVAVDSSFNRSGPSDFATAVLPDVTPPEKPFVKQIGYTSEGIVVEWSQNVEQDLAGYHIYRSDSSVQGYTQVNVDILAPFSFKYTDRSAEANRVYYYQLEARDQTGNVSERSALAYAKWYVETQLDGKLSLKIKSRKRRKVNQLEWTTINSSEIKGYVVFRGKSERVVKPLTGVIKGANTYTDKVKKDSDYFYQVRAYTKSGQVIYSPKVEQLMN